MSPMTYERWKQIERLQLEKALKENPTANRTRIIKRLRKAMVATHGKCPPKPKVAKPPLKIRLGLWWLKRKLKNTEAPMLVKKIIVSVGAGVAAGFAAYGPAAVGGVTPEEWGAVITAGLIAAYAAFKSNTTWLSPARKGESVTKFGPDQ